MLMAKNKLSDGTHTVQPIYEVIKRHDLVAAFRIAIQQAMAEVTGQLNELIAQYSTTAQPSLWVWDSTSRWDYDKFW